MIAAITKPSISFSCRGTLQQLVFKVSDEIMKCFEEVISKSKKNDKDHLPLTQQRALQLIFDVKFILQTIPRKDDTAVSICKSRRNFKRIKTVPMEGCRVQWSACFISFCVHLQESKSYQKSAARIIESLEEKVDPFDLDVFSPYMMSHLMKQGQRSTVRKQSHFPVCVTEQLSVFIDFIKV